MVSFPLTSSDRRRTRVGVRAQDGHGCWSIIERTALPAAIIPRIHSRNAAMTPKASTPSVNRAWMERDSERSSRTGNHSPAAPMEDHVALGTTIGAVHPVVMAQTTQLTVTTRHRNVSTNVSVVLARGVMRWVTAWIEKDRRS